MTRKKKDNSTNETALIALIFGVVVLIVCGILVIPYYLYLKAKYASGTGARRINDFRQFAKVATIALLVHAAIGLFILLPAINILWLPSETEASPTVKLIGACLFGFWVYLVMMITAWLAAVHLGVVVNCSEDKLVFRIDQESYDLIDYLTLRFIRDLPRFDAIPISAIRRITRQHGVDIYLMGDFGSRRITFSNKQKRDECIYAITACPRSSAKLFSEFETT